MRSRGTAFSSAGWAIEPPPGGGAAGETGGTAADGAGPAGAAGLALPDAAAARISFLLMRPPAPLPSTAARSTLCSFASLRTSGELRIFWPLPRAAGGAGDDAGALAAAGGAGAGTGGGAVEAGCAAAGLGTADFSGAGDGTGAAAGVAA